MDGPAAPPVRLHPNLSQLYRRKIEHLQQALDTPGTRDEAIHVLRGLVERILIGAVEGGLEVEIVGEIARMIDLGQGLGNSRHTSLDERMARSVKVIAGARNQRYLHLDYTTSKQLPANCETM